MKSFGILIGMAAAGTLLAGAVLAADLPLPPPKPRPQNAAPAQEPNAFERLSGDCIEAWDGCQRFRRAADGRFDALNNIGIACQPQPLSCTVRR